MTLVMSSEVETSRCETLSGATGFLDPESFRGSE
jgi:hypothetical protein